MGMATITNMRYILLFFMLCLAPISAESGLDSFDYYNTARCGNDYFYRCSVTPNASGADFKVYSGFMNTPLVESGKLSEVEWKEFKSKLWPLVPQPSQDSNGFPTVGIFVRLPGELNGIKVTPEFNEAFAETRPGKVMNEWLSGKHS